MLNKMGKKSKKKKHPSRLSCLPTFATFPRDSRNLGVGDRIHGSRTVVSFRERSFRYTRERERMSE
jgi:erythromycin esterase-like protein